MGCPEKLRGIYGEDVVKITGFLFLHRKKYGKMSVSHIIERSDQNVGLHILQNRAERAAVGNRI